MDHKDEFSKWMSAVEEALTSEAAIEEDMPPVTNQCGCGSWDCPACFPDQQEMPGMHGALDGIGGADVAVGGEVCPACGSEIDGHNHNEPEMGMGAMGAAVPQHGPNIVFGGMEDGLEEMPMTDMGTDSAQNDMGSDEVMQAPMEEEPQEFEQLPRSSDGRGVKLGDIVHKTEYRKVGQESPLTHGEDNLGEAPQDEFSDMNEPDWDADPLAVRDYHNTMDSSPKSEQDINQMEEWISSILHMQAQGLSKSSTLWDESDFAAMGPDQVKQAYQEVTGNMAEQGMYTMENIDTDVAAMLATLKKYDTMIAEKDEGKHNNGKTTGFDAVAKKAASEYGSKEAGEKVAGAVHAKMAKAGKLEEDDESDKKNPWEKLGADKKEGEKTSKTHKGGTVTKTDSGLSHKGTYGSGKDDVKEGADPEVLEWMSRFSKLGNMKGYGR